LGGFQGMTMISNDESCDGTARDDAHPSRREIIAGAATASSANIDLLSGYWHGLACQWRAG
jgi:hypothetical protein